MIVGAPRSIARLLFVTVLLSGPGVRAVRASVCTPARPAADALREWPAPLDRRLTVQLGDVTLRAGLERLASDARIRLSYAADLLPLDRRLCVIYKEVRAGAILADLLRGTSLEPIVVGRDQIVLAPTINAWAQKEAQPVQLTQRAPSVLENVVVNGSAESDGVRASALPVTVVTGKQLVERGASSLAQALGGVVPGIWLWTQSPSTPLARFGGIRGASSFGETYPKVYVDGVEVANPLLVSRLNAESIDRIEIVRGPQGAALYGADAISGVINIFTLHEGGAEGVGVRMRTETGVSRSDFASRSVLAREMWVAGHTGSSTRSAGLNLSVSTLGDFVPGGSSRHVLANGDVRLVGARTIFTASARLFDWKAGLPDNPLVVTPGEASGVQTAREYTLGTTLAVVPNDVWTHSIVAGVDGFRSGGLWTGVGKLAAPVNDADDASDRATIRLTSEAHVGAGAVDGRLTFAFDHSLLREDIDPTIGQGPFAPPALFSAWRATTGLVAQNRLSFGDRLYVNGGLRIERNDGYATYETMAMLPMLGAAYVMDVGAATLKLRSSYGKAIRPPRTSSLRAMSQWGMHVAGASPDLTPESQAGIDWGADLSIGSASISATRFDQRASGLIETVAVGYGGRGGPGPSHHDLIYQWQNVGDVTNRGWELEGGTRLGPLALRGTLSFVESRVASLTNGYTGELRPGDRMLGVPSRLASLTASWSSPGWSTSWTVSRAADWVGYDQLAIADALDSAEPGGTPRDESFLRQFWIGYPGVTRFRATATRDLVRGFTLTFTGDNLLGYQRGEPDNVTVVPGRTLLLGVRARF